MKLLLLITFTIISFFSKGQNPSRLIGRWRVIVMDNGVRYDYKNEKYTVSKALADSLNKWKNPLFDLNDFIDWASSCRHCYYVFGKDSSFQEFRDSELAYHGYFSILNDSTANVVLKTPTNKIPRTIQFKMDGQDLIIKTPSFFLQADQKIELVLERAD